MMVLTKLKKLTMKMMRKKCVEDGRRKKKLKGLLMLEGQEKLRSRESRKKRRKSA
jgi:hypothetical protein